MRADNRPCYVIEKCNALVVITDENRLPSRSGRILGGEIFTWDIAETSYARCLRNRTRRKLREIYLSVRVFAIGIENGPFHQSHVRIVDVIKIRTVDARHQFLGFGRRGRFWSGRRRRRKILDPSPKREERKSANPSSHLRNGSRAHAVRMEPLAPRILHAVWSIGRGYRAVPGVDTLARGVVEALGPVRTVAALRRLIQVSYRASQFIRLSQSCLTEKNLRLPDVLDGKSEAPRKGASFRKIQRAKPAIHSLPRRKADLVQLLSCVA